ncbi:MAG: hypothetical protein MMC23_000315 [Stictis urceolatum]|nr:hypothetical protein [Stictis urceolata]
MSFPHFTQLPPITDRASFQNACASLLHPLTPFFSPAHTRVTLGSTGTRYDETGAQIEGYARPLWGLAALLAGGGTYVDTWRFVSGLKNGCDPSHAEFWGYAKNIDQRMVEMCPIGFTLCVAPAEFWDGLGEKGQRDVAEWLRWINDKQMPDTNWLWFRVFAQLALWKNGLGIDEERMEKDMTRLEEFYRGNGWSNDGPRGYTQMDSYSGSYAIQYLQLLYAKIAGSRDPERAERFRERARLFALDAVHYYDEVGRHITFGRSLTYRFAMAGFWSAMAFADVEPPAPLSWGIVKGLLLRNCRWWAGQKNILSSQGTLTIGYCYPNQFMSENYNSPGSPYWFMLSFAALACPADHPFWAAREEPLPVASIPKIKPLNQPGHIMCRSGGHTFLLSSGQMCHYPVRAGASKYGKFAYSSAFGYSVPTGDYFIEAVGGDNTIALSDDFDPKGFGETWRTRRVAVDARIETLGDGPVLLSGWKPWPDVSVDSWLIPPTEQAPNWHLRVHKIKTERDLRAAEGAWSLYGYNTKDDRELEALSADDHEGIEDGEISALAVSRAGAVGIKEMHLDSRRGKVLQADANGNLIDCRTVLPTLFADLEKGEERWWITAVFAVPESVEGWKNGWRKGWDQKAELPDWVRNMVSGK